MVSSSFWECDRVKFKQLPTLQEALRACDSDVLVRVLLDDRAAAPDAERGGPGRKAARKRLGAALKTMRSLPVDTKANRNRILFPEESFVLRGASMLVEHRVGVVLLAREDFPAVRRARTALDGDAVEAKLPQRDLALRPWDQMLADKVWLAGPWCLRERYAALASAFWEMTYFGFEYDRACARMMEERARRVVGGRDAGRKPQGLVFKGATVSDVAAARALAWGLAEPDRIEAAYRDRLAKRVAALNEAARRELCDRVLDLEERLSSG